MLKFEELTWEEIQTLDRGNTCLFLPLSPIEAHGPHLPVGTDIFGARDFAAKAAGIVMEREPRVQSVLLPVIPLGCCGVTEDFPGTISVNGRTFCQLVTDVCKALAEQGFLYLAISNHHLDPVHMKAVLTAIETIESEFPIKILETGSRIVYSGMGLEQIERGKSMGLDMGKEVHADVKETAFILSQYPHLLKDKYMVHCPGCSGLTKRESLRCPVKGSEILSGHQWFCDSTRSKCTSIPHLGDENHGLL